MSYPYPQDRHRDRREKGNQPYQDAKEALRESEVDLQTEAEAYGEARRHGIETDEERAVRIAAETEDRLREVGEEVGRRGHDEPFDETTDQS